MVKEPRYVANATLLTCILLLALSAFQQIKIGKMETDMHAMKELVVEAEFQAQQAANYASEAADFSREVVDIASEARDYAADASENAYFNHCNYCAE